jgi:uncharacterized protein (DUF488 family)
VRTIPRSRRNPQFGEERLRAALLRDGIAYERIPELGGLRRGLGALSPNGAWRNASFRGYADHMLTDEFARGLARLLALARRRRVAVMCAEAVPWRCHRSLVADALVARGVPVFHITSARTASPHRVTEFAKVDGARVTYPAAAGFKAS